jgi:hypothetical protein
VTAVEITVVVEDEGITDPEEIPVVSVHGTVRVVKIWMVVLGTDVATAPVVATETDEAQVTMAGLLGM